MDLNSLTAFLPLMQADGTAAGTTAAPAAANGGAAPAAGAEGNTNPLANSQAAPTPGGGQQPAPQGDNTQLMLMLGLFVVMMIVMIVLPARTRKKQQAAHQAMFDSLKRDDQIMLQSGKHVFVDKVEKDHIIVFADLGRTIREKYHRGAVIGKSQDQTGPEIKRDPT